MKELAILCVDDESTILHAITEEIRDIVDDHIIIESALNADEALEVCEELVEEGVELALVISDCIMPGMQGDKLLEKIHNLYPDTFKVMLTGQADLNAVQYAINHAKLYRYLTKPWAKEDMKLTVQSALDSYNNNLELESYRKELEKKVQERTDELQEAMNIVHEYAYYSLVDKDGIIKESSENFAKICGVRADDLIGKSLFETFADDTKDESIERIKKALSEGVEIECEVEHQYKSFVSTWVDMKLVPKVDQKAGETLFSINRHDINDKKYIQKLVDTDVLTSLYNRRFFNTLFPKELERAKRDKKSFAFIMIDVDNFKKYNDTYGHQKGDDALKTVANVLNQVANRGSDFAFRLGGEEFALIVSGIDNENIQEYADKINKLLLEKKVEHKTNDASPYLTSSIGVVLYEDGNITDDMDSIIKIADDLLYKAKENGRNQALVEKR